MLLEMKFCRPALLVVAAAFWPSGPLPATPAEPLAQFRSFANEPRKEGLPAGWATFTPRAEISPRFAVDAAAGRNGTGALKIDSGGDNTTFGGWRRRVEGISGGRTYRFTAWYRAKNVANERRSVIARLEWLDEKGRQVRPPDYALDAGRSGEWTKVEYITPVPDSTRAVEIQEIEVKQREAAQAAADGELGQMRMRLSSLEKLAERQQQVLSALVKQLGRPENWWRLPDVYLAILQNIDTDLTPLDIALLGPAVLWVGPDGIDRQVLSQGFTSNETLDNGAAVVMPDWTAIDALVDVLFRQ